MARKPIGRQQLLDAARAELVASHGVLELAALTRRTGLSTGALYHHFGSKAGLLAAVYTAFYDGLLVAIADAHLDDDADWPTRERDRTRRFVDYHHTDPLAPILLARTAIDPELAESEAAYLQLISDNAATNIRAGQLRGDLAADIDADSAGAFVIGGLRRALAQQLRLRPRPDVATVSDTLWRSTAGALGIRDRGDTPGGGSTR